MSETLTGVMPLVAGREPETVFVPETLAELRSLVAQRDGLTLVPAGARTQLDLGGPPAGPFALLDLTRCLVGEVQHQRDDLTAVVPAAVTLGAIADVLAQQGQWLPLDPPLGERATVGGTLAVGGGGPLRTRYGLPRDFVLGATVLRADGVLVKAGGRVVKNVTGYDLMRLWCGSLGTIGIVTEVALRVLPRAETVDLVVECGSLGEASTAAERVLYADLRPELAEATAADGGWLLHLRVPAAGHRAATQLVGGTGRSEDGAALYIAERDAGFRDGEALTVRIAATPGGLRGTVEAILALRPSTFVVRPLVGAARATWAADKLPNVHEFAGLLARTREQVAPSGGSAVVERMPGNFRKAPVETWGIPPMALGLMRAVKATWDPDGRLNAGRFIGGL